MPSESGKPTEVRIVRVYLCLVFYCEGGDVSIRYEIRANAGGSKILPKVSQMVGTGIDRCDVRIPKPICYIVNGFRGR